MLAESLERGALDGPLGKGVLDDLVSGLRLPQFAPQIGDLRDVEPLVVDDDRALGSLERALELCQLFLFFRSRDCHDECLLLNSRGAPPPRAATSRFALGAILRRSAAWCGTCR